MGTYYSQCSVWQLAFPHCYSMFVSHRQRRHLRTAVGMQSSDLPANCVTGSVPPRRPSYMDGSTVCGDRLWDFGMLKNASENRMHVHSRANQCCSCFYVKHCSYNDLFFTECCLKKNTLKITKWRNGFHHSFESLFPFSCRKVWRHKDYYLHLEECNGKFWQEEAKVPALFKKKQNHDNRRWSCSALELKLISFYSPQKRGKRGNWMNKGMNEHKAWDHLIDMARKCPF